MASNGLVANESKTCFMVIRNKREKTTEKQSIMVGDAKINESETIKFLGVTITNNLSWSEQLTNVKHDLVRANGLLRRLAAHVPKSFLMPIVHGYIMSKIRYALPIYGEIKSTDEDQSHTRIKDIQIELNKALRLVLNVRCQDHVHTEKLLKEANISSVNQLSCELLLTEIWKGVKNNQAPKEFFTFIDEQRQRKTRSQGKLLLDAPKEPLFAHIGAKLWNKLPQQTKETDEIKIAKKEINTFSRSLPT